MTLSPLSRRRFTGSLAAGLGAALVARLEARPAAAGATEILLNSNENPYGPSARALEAMEAARGVAARYPDAAEERLLAALASEHAVDREQVVLGCGSGEVLRMAGGAFLGPGRKVVVCEPTFEAVLSYARVTRAEAVKVPQTADFRHDLPRMLEACDASTGLVYVCNPNNPTGTLVTRAELARFLERIPPGAAVLVDEAYHHFVEDGTYASAVGWLGRFPNVVVVRTFSKIHGLAGMRLGYAVASRENAAALRAHATWSNGNAAVLAAALASLEDGPHLERQRALNRETREWVRGELERDGRRVIPSHANFLMTHVGEDVGPLIEGFRMRGVLVGRRFPAMPLWLRVSIGTRPEMERFLGVLRELAAPSAALRPTGS